MALVDRIPKTGRNEFHKYDYATEADITAAVRIEMARRQLMLTPSVVDSKAENIGKDGKFNRLVTIRVRYTLEDGESGETRQFDMLGEGSDSLDKAFYKAMTGATKYAVLKLFLIPTGDDPEKDDRKRDVPPPGGMQSLKKPEQRAAVVADSPEGRGEAAVHDRSLVLAFNNSEKKPLSALDVKALKWFASTLAKNAEDPTKAPYREVNLKAQSAVMHELAYRGIK